jgi:3-deoxy-D-manno-octulosonic-acid transferase
MHYYRLLTIILSPLILAHIIWKSVSNKQARYFWQRLGFGYSKLPKNCTWFHCASVGEVNTLLPLLKTLHANDDRLKFIITTNTITGSKIVAQQKLPYLFHSYLPFDWSFSVSRFINSIKPAALFVVETEIWPNLFSLCHREGIAIHIINARLSSKTTSAKPWIKSLLSCSLSKVTTISARSEQDAKAYELLGADGNKITTLGNLKFTTALSNGQETRGNHFSLQRGYALVASTHDDEESQIYELWKKLDRKELLIIVPRHPERGPAITKKLDCQNIAIRSKEQAITDKTEVYLLDTVGELKEYFCNARLVIMGGSFVPVGGHNILEPASYNRAIVTGPFMENFREELALMLEKDAIIQVSSIDELQQQLATLLDDDEKLETIQQNTALLSHNVEQVLADYSELILSQLG